jgi:hypothetical protein
VRAIFGAAKSDSFDPLVDEPSLSCYAEVTFRVDAAWESVFVNRPVATFEPSEQARPDIAGEFELIFTKSQPRDLLSISRSKSARSTVGWRGGNFFWGGYKGVLLGATCSDDQKDWRGNKRDPAPSHKRVAIGLDDPEPDPVDRESDTEHHACACQSQLRRGVNRRSPNVAWSGKDEQVSRRPAAFPVKGVPSPVPIGRHRR